ncbi:hypothetical protein [Streptomyces hygroscopicus]|uniref:hypothetical protein n=1 Tax=Streptomyces hygroscopicus TaxID=1912 RepID=UPI000A711974|nr:hypothetical protein [Streptomyces hygroscopicus]
MSRTVRVEYALTPLVRGMLEPPAGACRWATEHQDALLDAREGGEGGKGGGSPIG